MGGLTLTGSSLTYWFSQKAQHQQQEQINATQALLDANREITSGIQSGSLMFQAYIDTKNTEARQQWDFQWNSKVLPSLQLLANGKSIPDKLKEDIQNLYAKQEQNIEALLLNTAPVYQLQTSDLIIVTEALEQQSIQLVQKVEAAKEAQNNTFFWLKASGISVFIVCLIAGITLGTLLVAQIFRSLYKIKKAVKELSRGNLPENVWQSKNECGHITRELSSLITNLKNVEEFAVQVGEGKFDNQINVFNNEGELGSSLASMRDSLAQVAVEDKQRNWINEGFAKFADITRNHNSSISELSEITISNLVKYLKANQGAIFLVNEKENDDDTLLLQACYAYDRKKFLGKEIVKGEGLCGQAWLENDLILINDVPEDYVNIKSGLGNANPRSVLVTPLHANEKVQGVLELASFTEFEPYQVEFIKKIADNFASAISTARNNERTVSLLAEFQEMTEELRAQEEEMRQNMEELQATQEEMERARTEAETKEQNMNSVINNTSDTIFAIDRGYNITVVNQVLKNKYATMGIELSVGTNLQDLLPKSAWQKWKSRYDRAMAGEQYSVIEESSGSNGTRFSQTYHNPIKDEAGEVIGASVISRDVTDTEMAKMEIEKRRAMLRSFIDNSTDTFFAIDRNYNILLANQVLRNRFKSSGISLDEGENIFEKLPKEQQATWKDRYDRALSGESFVIEEERKVAETTLYIEVHVNPVTDEKGDVIGASVVSKDITRWKNALDAQSEKEQELQKLRDAIGMAKADGKKLMTNSSKSRTKTSNV